MKEIDELFYNFIWEGTSRIKKTVLCQDYCNGGLRMVNINAFIAALKATWLRKLITNNNQWIAILQCSLNIQNIFNFGVSYVTEKVLPKIKNKFWKDVFMSHIQVSSKNNPTEIQQFQTNPIFFNDNIKIGNKSIYNKSCIENGIKYINDITKEDGNIYTYFELKRIYNVNINFLQYSGLVRSILDWKKTLNLENIKNKVANPVLPFPVQVYLKSQKGTQDMYKILNENKDPPSGKISWGKKYNFDEEEWKKIFREPFIITKDYTIQWFQTRINHKILATNTFLYKIKLTNNPKCTFCSQVDETIEHLFWECEYVNKFLMDVISWIGQQNLNVTLNEKSFLFSLYNDKEINNVHKLVLMETKYYIYYSKCSKTDLNLTVLKYRLKLLYKTYKQASVFEGKYDAFQTHWQNYHELLG